MIKHRNIQELKAEVGNLRSITPWEDVKEKAIYHIPPITTLERREIIILTKNDVSLTYQRIGDKEQKERTMFKTSVFAKFLVKRKKY